MKMELLLKFLQREYLLPFGFAESSRHYLLRKRLEKFSMRNIKIPIIESEIDGNTSFHELFKELKNEKSFKRQKLNTRLR